MAPGRVPSAILQIQWRLTHPGAAAALAFYDLVALLQQPLALAILALLFFLDVGAFIVGHESLLTSAPGLADRSGVLALTGNSVPVYSNEIGEEWKGCMSEIVNNRAHHRYELALEGHIAAT
jgi:hypothetical protein